MIMATREARLGGEIGLKLKECYSRIELVDQMEEYFQHLDLLPNQDSSDPGILQLESQFLDMCSTNNIVESVIYIVPAYYDGKLFVRCMEQGMFKGFTSSFFSALTERYNIPASKVIPWMVYTDKDFQKFLRPAFK